MNISCSSSREARIGKRGILVIEKLQKEIHYIIDTILDNISGGYMDFHVYLGLRVYYFMYIIIFLFLYVCSTS